MCIRSYNSYQLKGLIEMLDETVIKINGIRVYVPLKAMNQKQIIAAYNNGI